MEGVVKVGRCRSSHPPASTRRTRAPTHAIVDRLTHSIAIDPRPPQKLDNKTLTGRYDMKQLIKVQQVRSSIAIQSLSRLGPLPACLPALCDCLPACVPALCD